MGRTFLYFAYGSNINTQRIHIQNKSANKKAIAVLSVSREKLLSYVFFQDYQLDFDFYSQRWKGAVATVKESVGSKVIGVVWEINTEDLKNLDIQEGVHIGIYEPIFVVVETFENCQLCCRTYRLLKSSEDKRPSKTYKDIIITGAKENNFPIFYIESLLAVEDNGISEKVDFLEKL